MNNTYTTLLDHHEHTIEDYGVRHFAHVEASSIEPFALAILPGRLNGAMVNVARASWPYVQSDGMTGHKCAIVEEFYTDSVHKTILIGSIGIATVTKTISVRRC